LGAWAVVSVAVACGQSGTSEPAASGGQCEILFGRPEEKTGLDETRCQPACNCGATVWKAPSYDEAFMQGLEQDFQLDTPLPELTEDPYGQPAGEADPPDRVCAVTVLGDGAAPPRRYTLGTYDSEQQARAAGAKPTHFGRCGLCSTLGNLAVYMRHNDLAAPVRKCSLQGIGKDAEVTLSCLQALGFDRPCAQIWYFNSQNTQKHCMQTCVEQLNSPHHLPDGALNPCLLCDEEQSGAVFKAVAGRTRRNSGLPNAMCRPCSEVQPLEHAY
jgi:hypothetical protein